MPTLNAIHVVSHKAWTTSCVQRSQVNKSQRYRLIVTGSRGSGISTLVQLMARRDELDQLEHQGKDLQTRSVSQCCGCHQHDTISMGSAMMVCPVSSQTTRENPWSFWPRGSVGRVSQTNEPHSLAAVTCQHHVGGVTMAGTQSHRSADRAPLR